MKQWRESWQSIWMILWQPSNVIRTVGLIILGLVFTSALIVPMLTETRFKFIFAGVGGVIYALALWMPILPGKKALVEAIPFWVTFINTVFFGILVYVFFDLSSMIALVFLIPIVGAALRRGLRLAIWSASLSSLGYLGVYVWRGAPSQYVNDTIVFITVFFIIALFTGSLAQALQQRNLEFEKVVTHSHEAIFIVDRQGRLEYFNPSAHMLIGYDLAELAGQSFFDLVALEDRETARAVWEKMREGHVSGEPYTLRVLTRDGSQQILAATFAPFDLAPPRYMITTRDITLQEIEREQHERRHRELDAERAVAHAVSQTLELDQVLDLALDRALAVLGLEAGAIFLADEAQTTLTLAVARNIDDKTLARVRPYHFGEGITGSAALKREVTFVSNVPADERVRPELREVMSIHAQISVPLIVGERVVGVLNLSTSKPHQIAGDDIVLLRAIGASVAIAIDRARLFETLERRVFDRTAKLTALNRIAAATNRSLKTDEILRAALDELTQTLHLPKAWVYLLDAQSDKLIVRAEHGRTGTIDTHNVLRLGEGLSGRVAQDGQPRALNIESSDISTRDKLLAQGYRSIAAVPLIVEEKIQGVLGVASAVPNHFGDAELRWLGAVGNTLAVGLNNAQLFESERRAREKAQALRQAAHAISGTLNLDQVLRLLLQQLKSVLTYDTASVLLFREADQPLLVTGIGYNDETTTSREASNLLKTSPILSRMASDLQPITIADVHQHPDWIWVPGARHVRSFLAVPITSQDKMIGTLMADSAQVGFFKEDDVQHAQTLAQHIAVALNNAQLFESVERRAAQLATLREIDRALSAILEPQPMLEAVLDAVAQIVPYDSAAVLVLEDTHLRAVAARGIASADLQHLSFDTSRHPGFYRLWNKRVPAILGEVNNSNEWIATPGLEDVRSWLGVPLVARDQVLGQLSLYHRAPNAFTKEHGELVLAFANHAAIAIANAQLRAALHAQARHDSLTQVLNHGTFIHELRQASEAAQRAEKSLALIMLDLDNFKQYNDTYGHVVGDEVLCATVHAIRTHIKQADLVGRWGGEEFGVALLNANEAHAVLVAERIRTTLATAKIHDRHGTPIPSPTVSQGIAVLGQTAHSLDELIEQADRALYHAKQRGKDQIICAQ